MQLVLVSQSGMHFMAGGSRRGAPKEDNWTEEG